MPEHSAVFLAYSHLRDFPRADDALHTLRRVASLVKPLMRARHWKVRELAEFYPEQANLLGLNINRGQKILLRLRYPGGDASLFLPLEQIADTLLHELAHIVHGPHDAVFQALWDQLRDEHMALALKGFTGEAFLSEGRRLGGGGGGNDFSAAVTAVTPANHLRRPIPMDEARRLARAAAERRQAKAVAAEKAERERSWRNSTGQRLGGSGGNSSGADTPSDMRRVVADAVARRNRHTPETLRGCATDGPQYDDRTREWLADQASRNGFRTQAEEDAANDAAIAQALWELVQEDEKKRLGDRYVPPTVNGGGSTAVSASSSNANSNNNANRIRRGSSSTPIVIDDSPRQQRRPAPPPPPPPPRVRRSSISAPTPGTVTRSSAPASSGHSQRNSTSGHSYRESTGSSSSSSSRGWTCTICTLHNPSTYLVCDACGVEKPSSPKDKSSSHRHSSSHSSQPQPTLPTQQPTGPPPSHHHTHSHPPLPPPRRSHAASSAATAASSRVSSSSQHKHHQQQTTLPKKPKVKKTVRFTPSTRGGSISSATSTSIRARARSGSPPPPNASSRANMQPPALQPRPSSSVASSSGGSSANDASSTWMCTACWKNMGGKYAACDSCGKPKEAWQQRM
ncbi:hypothetical protein SBRCBS47491_008856 [Sporothrix bragantina]|uniref:Zinc metallopeptidase n=1 Tax=Sporothrix bragantina TaxID=671064 RepID=A0ABP0CSK8_9PEZI